MLRILQVGAPEWARARVAVLDVRTRNNLVDLCAGCGKERHDYIACTVETPIFTAAGVVFAFVVLLQMALL